MNRASVNSGAPSNDHIYMYLESSPQNRWVSAGDIFEEIKARIIPNLMKTINPQIQEAHQNPRKRSTKIKYTAHYNQNAEN